MTADDPVSQTLQSWADRELEPWRQRKLRRMATERALHALADRNTGIRLYRFAERDVTLQPPKPGQARDDGFEYRARIYLRLFRAAAALLPPTLTTTIAMGLGDRVLPPFDDPVFGFQRQSDEPTPLLPDIDMIMYDYYQDDSYRDPVSDEDKAPHAVFAGSTTGAIFDLKTAQNFALPRLRAARFFEHVPEVDFLLPGIAQCSDEARAFLETQSFCQCDRLSWHEQFRSRFLLSMDGNGATCSRVAVALMSRSTLIKYDSDYILYYFPALVPHHHYVPVSDDLQVLSIVTAATRNPARYAAMSSAANAFAAAYLTRARVLEYTARLINSYAGMLWEGNEATDTAPARHIACTVRTLDGTILQADDSGWAGTPGGQPLAGFNLVTTPNAGSFRLLYQARQDNGRFTPTAREGKWCAAEDDGAALTEISLELSSGIAMPVVIEAQFADGSQASSSQPGKACRGPGGSPIVALRVRLA
jgi:hypothetical protein